MRLLPLVLVPLALTACEPEEGALGDPGRSFEDDAPGQVGSGTILGIGDSYFEWNLESGESIPDVVGRALGVTAHNLAISGAMLLEPVDDIPAIPDMYEPGDYDWVVMDGGGNDVEGLCGCGACGGVINAMLSTDGTGVIPDLVDRATADGARVAWVGYAQVSPAAEGYQGCDDELETMVTRLTALADSRDDMIFVDGRQAFGPSQPAFYDDDLVHPSVQGSRALGELTAEAIRAAE